MQLNNSTNFVNIAYCSLCFHLCNILKTVLFFCNLINITKVGFQVPFSLQITKKQFKYMLFRLDYSSGNLNLRKQSRLRCLGEGNAHEYKKPHTTEEQRTSLPKIPQHHLANCLYAICRFCLCGGPSYASWYSCLYWYHAV